MGFSSSHIMITGGTGTLGCAMCRHISTKFPEAQVTIFSRGEGLQASLRSIYPQFRYILGDVANKDALRRAMIDVDVVFHFAAYKQVPSAQNNVAATVASNVHGSQNVVDVALENKVKQVVAASTDKSCASINAYGASKYLMECLFQNANMYGNTTFHLARYGNVIGSTGSVIPLFQKQAKNGGPLTVTDPCMTRFWITVEQAVDLVLLALDSPPGAVVVPKAPAMSMVELASVVGGDLPVKEIGVRAGEKTHEAMVNEAESVHTKDMGDYFLIFPHSAPEAQALLLNSHSFSYTSNNPARWLSREEMRELIGE